jgi:hypothetical protein
MYHSTITDKGTPSSHATIYRIDTLRVMRQQSPRQRAGDYTFRKVFSDSNSSSIQPSVTSICSIAACR